ncbi:MAG TPA: Fur family transcriptional regulator [Candidatus Saccharimonadales bacterium]|nr:Fur family transcriptional regulator [Candidatus Saccharimonadales bacterium]
MTEEHFATFAKCLRQARFSLTKPRLAVLNAMIGREPISMPELAKLTKDELDRASLYRTIQLFEKLGVVQRLQTGWKYKLELSDKFSNHHHHLTCLGCGKVTPINETELEDFIERSAAANDFKTTSHQIEIQGYCSTCVK